MSSLSVLGNDRIRPGGNLDPFEAVSLEIEDLYAEARNFADGEPIASQEMHDAVSALFDGLADAGKRAEALRVEQVRPLDEQKAEIQARFHPLIGDTKAGKGKVILGKAALGELLTAWRVEQKRLKDAAALQARIEQEEIAAKAREAMKASAGDLEAREQAEAMVNDAKIAERDARRTEKAATTGIGLRTSYRAEIADFALAARHYWQPYHARFEALVLTIAQEEVRAGKHTIPGVNVIEERKAL